MQSKYGGYMGRVLQINLSTGDVTDYPWTDKDRELYIGGKTMAAKILYDTLTGRENAYSEENPLIISTGPLTGTGAPSSSRFNISSLSPQTGFISSSNCGGTFCYHLKRAGIDALIITGRREERTWIEIDNGSVTFHNADDLWGTRVTECQRLLAEKMSSKRGCDIKFGKLCIGPAGENLVRYSAVISDERAAGRTGMGAVLGWKNVKAIAVFGNHDTPVHDPSATKKWCQKWFRYLRNHPLTGNQLPRMGTAGLVSSMQMRGLLATKNYTEGRFEHFDKVNGETLAEEYNIVNKGCLSCPIKCARTVTVEGEDVKGPELETLGLLGGGILNKDLYHILKWNKELDDLGLDTISASNTLAYAMEANERGLWNNGLKFGDIEGISKIWDDIAYRRGIGNELAEGSKRLSEKYGGKEFAMQSKGLELAAYEPRRARPEYRRANATCQGGLHHDVPGSDGDDFSHRPVSLYLLRLLPRLPYNPAQRSDHHGGKQAAATSRLGYTPNEQVPAGPRVSPAGIPPYKDDAESGGYAHDFREISANGRARFQPGEGCKRPLRGKRRKGQPAQAADRRAAGSQRSPHKGSSGANEEDILSSPGLGQKRHTHLQNTEKAKNSPVR